MKNPNVYPHERKKPVEAVQVGNHIIEIAKMEQRMIVKHQDDNSFDYYLRPGPDGKLPTSPYLKK